MVRDKWDKLIPFEARKRDEQGSKRLERVMWASLNQGAEGLQGKQE